MGRWIEQCGIRRILKIVRTPHSLLNLHYIVFFKASSSTTVEEKYPVDDSIKHSDKLAQSRPFFKKKHN